MSGSDRKYRTRDPLRALWHDTMPDEVPVVISNRGVHHNLTELELTSFDDIRAECRGPAPVSGGNWWKRVVARIFDDDDGTVFERPMEFDVLVGGGKRRRLALPHVRSQFRFARFMHDRSDSILHYAARSPCSLRAPRSVGRDTVLEEDDGIEEVPTGTLRADAAEPGDAHTTNTIVPSRFFLYRGYRRLHRFFDSREFLSLEERFPLLCIFDVQSAFPSVYTHSMAWAIRGKEHAKGNIGQAREAAYVDEVRPFGADFDVVMQRSNWNETNGILVGPEISRVFAELIFQAIDSLVCEGRFARTVEEEEKRGYAVRRYVDDYYVFAADAQAAAKVKRRLEVALEKYLLRLNEGKSEYLERPFLNSTGVTSSRISAIIGERFSTLDQVEARWTPENDVTHRGSLGRWRHATIHELRAATKGSPGGLDLAVSRVSGALRTRVFRLLDGADDLTIAEVAAKADQASMLADTAGYLFSVRPTHQATLSFVSCALVTNRLNMLAGGVAARAASVEKTYERCLELVRRSTRLASGERERLTVCNVLIAMAELPAPFNLDEQQCLALLGLTPATVTGSDYFQLVAFLYSRRESTISRRVSQDICNALSGELDESGIVQAGLVHSILDVLACPHFDVRSRRGLLRKLGAAVNVPHLAVELNAEADRVLQMISARPWFVDWTGGTPLVEIVRRSAVRHLY